MEHPLDQYTAVCQKLAAFELVFFDRSYLNLSEVQIGGILETIHEIQDTLEEIEPELKEQFQAKDNTTRGHQPPHAEERFRDILEQPADSSGDATELLDAIRRPAGGSAPSEARDILYGLYKDAALVRNLSWAADALLLTEGTDKGAGPLLFNTIMEMVGQIKEAAARVEEGLEEARSVLQSTDAAPQQHRPTPAPAASGVDLTEEAPPEQRHDPDAKPGDTTRRNRA